MTNVSMPALKVLSVTPATPEFQQLPYRLCPFMLHLLSAAMAVDGQTEKRLTRRLSFFNSLIRDKERSTTCLSRI